MSETAAQKLEVTREERGSSRWIHVTGPMALYGKARYVCAAEAHKWAKEEGFRHAFWVSGGGSMNADTFRYSRSYGFDD